MDILRYYRKKRIKFIIKIIILVVVLVFPITYCFYTNIPENYKWNLLYNCYGIGQIDDYVSYNMLSDQLKRYIKKDDLNFSTVEDIVETSKKLESIDYEYRSNSKYVVSSASSKQNPLDQIFEIDGVEYAINHEIIFAPRLFSLKPEVVDWNVTVHECRIEQK